MTNRGTRVAIGGDATPVHEDRPRHADDPKVSGANPRRWGALAWTAIVAVVALASSLAGLLFELRPDLKRDPRSTLGADVSIFSVDPGVTYREYLEDFAFSDQRSRRAVARRVRWEADLWAA